MEALKNMISFILFLIFFFSYITKLIILKKKYHIQANVLAKGYKKPQIKYTELFVKTTTFLWGIMWFLLPLTNSPFHSCFYTLPNNQTSSLIGLIITAIGVTLFIFAMLTMKTSWRVGIDQSSKTALITDGIYKYTRNPAFVGFDLMFLGVFLTYPNLLTLFLFILNALAIHFLILREEKHLHVLFGKKYAQYCKDTPRYIYLRRILYERL